MAGRETLSSRGRGRSCPAGRKPCSDETPYLDGFQSSWGKLLLRRLAGLGRGSSAEWIAALRAECALADRLADSGLLALRIQGLLHAVCRVFERIPDKFPIEIFLTAMVDLLRRGVDFARNAGQERA
jgi:hypothetical protein